MLLDSGRGWGVGKTWQHVRYGEERYVDESGKILADVQDSLTSSETTATVRFHGSLGSYISRDAAKRAVERHFASATPMDGFGEGNRG